MSAIARSTSLTGKERLLDENDIIVSKTDPAGKITYCNLIFREISDYSTKELIGKPHSIIRHPEMPKAVFKMLWENLKSGKEIFAYVVNRCKNGDHYWVFAHVTPSFNANNEIIGFHSNRRSPCREAVPKIIELYKILLAEESKWPGAESASKGYEKLMEILKSKGVTYEQFVLSL